MKKFTSVLLVCVLLLGVMFTLVSCGNTLSGTYEGMLFDLKFKGSKVTIIINDEEALTGTYEIKDKDDDKQTIAFDFVDEKDADEDEKKALELIDAILGSDLSFEKGDDYIKIGLLLKFTKK